MPTDADKLRVLLPHWHEHNAEHAAEFRSWATRAGEAGEELSRAAELVDAANRALAAALEKLGGPLEATHHH